jgi:hypothetical protein
VSNCYLIIRRKICSVAMLSILTSGSNRLLPTLPVPRRASLEMAGSIGFPAVMAIYTTAHPADDAQGKLRPSVTTTIDTMDKIAVRDARDDEAQFIVCRVDC